MAARSTAPNPNPSGLCRCGCGKPTTIATASDSRTGKVRGYPTLYLRGHNNHIRQRGRRPEQARTALIDTSVTRPLADAYIRMARHGAEFMGVCNGRDVYECAGCGSPMQAAPDRKAGDRYRIPRGIRRHEGYGRCSRCKGEARRLAEPSAPKPALQDDGVDMLALLTAGTEWAARGACRSLGRTGGYEPFDLPDGHDQRDPVPAESVRAARRYCARCPVLAECAEFADRADSPRTPLTGLWAGQWRTTSAVTPITTAGPASAAIPA